MGMVTPVSYTHLDVYKRQSQDKQFFYFFSDILTKQHISKNNPTVNLSALCRMYKAQRLKDIMSKLSS